MFAPGFAYFAFTPIGANTTGELSSAQMFDLLTMGIVVPIVIVGIFTFIGGLIVIRIWFQPAGATVGDALRHGIALAPVATMLHLLISLCTLVGFALFIIPGMIVATCTILILPLLADRAPGGALATWGEGWNLAQRNFWPLFGLVLIAGLLGLAVAAMLGVLDGSYSNEVVQVSPMVSGFVNGATTLAGGMINAAIAAAAYRQIRTPDVHEIFS